MRVVKGCDIMGQRPETRDLGLDDLNPWNAQTPFDERSRVMRSEK